MKLDKLPDIFKESLHILKAIEAAGFEAYFVGGSVRDHLLNLPIHDVDIATSAYPDEIKKIFPRTIDTGIEHGTVTVMDDNVPYEITTFRTESGYQDFRRPDKVTFVRKLKDDLQRRDFTINALAVATDGEVIDEFSGLEDLKSKTIRAVGVAQDRFHEDALRMMRAVRFQSQLGFVIEEETLKAIELNAELLEKISVERINTEFVKMLLAKNWQLGYKNFLTTDLYKYCPQLNNKHYELTKLLEYKDIQIVSVEAAWAILTEAIKTNDLNKFLTLWKESNKVKADVQSINKLIDNIEEDNYDVWSFYKVGDTFLNEIDNICELRHIDYDRQKVINIYNQLPIKSKKELAIDGKTLIKELNLKPGPQLGKLLTEIEKKVVFGQLENNSNKIILYCKNLI
ncbi:CCA-adding enzyme [Companilactobacillus sp. RD055328]|uniref:CCA tRNA nucleotidyltransferase n=1 Tax=Companilactobacillus sp. RD055328 TaxID=2916634 RepID=UPI001FC83F15|nr:CCA tRNA nucleotidyltransferase [Companilactobacillus sp. RD055328]GKQ42731.1 CCA-adding enzyme [Companilactobacillus sp. RD055328]